MAFTFNKSPPSRHTVTTPGFLGVAKISRPSRCSACDDINSGGIPLFSRDVTL
jgi:hypothetical protein